MKRIKEEESHGESDEDEESDVDEEESNKEQTEESDGDHEEESDRSQEEGSEEGGEHEWKKEDTDTSEDEMQGDDGVEVDVEDSRGGLQKG